MTQPASMVFQELFKDESSAFKGVFREATPSLSAEGAFNMKPVSTFVLVVSFAILAALPLAGNQQQTSQSDLTDQPALVDPTVEFGHPDVLLGAANLTMVPDEVTIMKGDRVNFRVNGPGHGIAIYPVSKNTTREHIGQYLCDGATPDCSPTQRREIRDADERVVIIVEEGGQAIRIDYEPGQILSAGTGAFLIGTARTATGTTTPGTVVRVRFEEDGRYLIVCMNRAHMVNDWMFGFVNVTTAR